jgi:hypothetical protein
MRGQTVTGTTGQPTRPADDHERRGRWATTVKGSDNSKLEVREQLTFTWHFGTVQRIGWAVMTLLVLAALGGFTGAGGQFSRKVIGAAEAPAVMRVGREDHVTIYQTGEAAALGPMAGDWLKIGHATPAGPAKDHIVLPVTPRKMGVLTLQLPTGPGEVAEVSVLILS